MMCIYAITNIKNGKRYIGSTIDFYRRKAEHLKWLKGNYHHSIVLQRAFNKYGLECFEFSIIEIVENCNDLIHIEQKYINIKSEYNSNKIAGRPPLQSLEALVTDINGNIVGFYENKILAFNKLGLKISGRKFPFYYSGYLFFDKDSTKEEIQMFVDKNRTKGRRLKYIYQFDDELNFIKKWKDIKDILKEYGDANFNCGITNAIKNKKRAYGFFWSYNKIMTSKYDYKGHKKKKVKCFINGELVKIFDSITECAKEMNDQKINIIKVCKKEKKHSKNIYYEYY